VDARDIGERSDAVLRTAMRGRDESLTIRLGLTASVGIRIAGTIS
jgi:hypothetical protein